MDRSYWKDKLEAYRNDTLPESEIAELWVSLADEENKQGWGEVLTELSAAAQSDSNYRRESWQSMIDYIVQQGRVVSLEQPRRSMMRWLAIAAAVIALLGIGAWWLIQRNHNAETVPTNIAR